MIRICFVCLGNICRSPTAEAVFLDLIEKEGLSDSFAVDSAGTGGYHVGEQADARSRREAKSRGIAIRSRSRKSVANDFYDFDYLVAMDQSNADNLRRLAPEDGLKSKVVLFRDFEGDGPKGREVPDPYYGGPGGFGRVFDICESAARGLLHHVRETRGI